MPFRVGILLTTFIFFSTYLQSQIGCETDSLKIVVSSNSPICGNDSLRLYASGGVDYLWEGPNGFYFKLQNPVAQYGGPIYSGVYTATIYDSLGCKHVLTQNVIQKPLLNYSVTANNPICEGGTLKLQIIGADAEYEWTDPFNKSTMGRDLTITNIQVGDAGIYNLRAKSPDGCAYAKMINVIVNPKPKAKIDTPTTICGGERISLNAIGGINYKWSTGETSQSITVLADSILSISLIADNISCFDTTQIKLNAINGPKTNLPSEIISQIGNVIELDAGDAEIYEWETSTDLSCTDCRKPLLSVSGARQYCVQLNQNGCKLSACSKISIDGKCNLSLPSIFSPNNDSNNDEWCSPKLDCFNSQSLKIYDRWGNLLHKQTGEDLCWDGRSDGIPLSIGAYIYEIEILSDELGTQNFKGSITLVR